VNVTTLQIKSVMSKYNHQWAFNNNYNLVSWNTHVLSIQELPVCSSNRKFWNKLQIKVCSHTKL